MKRKLAKVSLVAISTIALIALCIPTLSISAHTFPSVLFSDNFERSWTEVNGTWSIVNDGTGNHVYVQSLPYYIPGVRSVGDTNWTDYTVQAKVKVTGTTWGRWGGVLLRATAPDTYYELYLQETGNLQLVRTVSGVRTGLVNPFVGTFYDQWWNIKAEISGSNIKGKAWQVGDAEPGSWIIDYTDPSPIANGKVGLITFSDVANQPVYFDDVIVKDITGTTTLFSDDFELNWEEVYGTWSVINDGTGNHVYYQSSVIDNSFAWAPTMIAGSNSWTDYEFKVAMKILGPVTAPAYGYGPCYRVNQVAPYGQYVIQVWNPGTGMELQVWEGAFNTWYPVASVPLSSYVPSSWYDFDIKIIGDHHIITMTDQSSSIVVGSLDFTDDTYTTGGIGLNAANEVQFDNVEVAVINHLPTVEAGGAYFVNEGSSVTVLATGNDADSDVLTYAWDLDNNATYETSGQSVSFPGIDGPATKTIGVQVTDEHGAKATDTATVNVANVAPTVTITAPTNGAVLPITPALALTATFTDPGIQDTHISSIDWDDTNTSTGTVVELNGSGTSSASHDYTDAGVYTITVTVTDKDGGAGTDEVMVVIYDPSAGFVTGGGWIMSPAGADSENPDQTGKATFGFVSKYKKGASIPDGQTEFQFKAGNLNFHSTSYDWLVVTGSNFAKFKGTGTINSEGEYKFQIWAGDGDPDTFRIKIWTEDEGGSETVRYDNGSNQPIGGGSIVVHTKKK
ncbi:PKD domain-containing protein [Chloroflexota bacterium]